MKDVLQYLKTYDGPPITLMEVCGTHTTEIARAGIPSLLSAKIRLLSGPGCPVCVTVTSYIDRLIELALMPGHCVLTFGDMLRVPGSSQSLADVRALGAHVDMVYSPSQMLELAHKHPDTNYIFAAVGFETTTAIYAEMLDRALREALPNVRILTSLKTMPAAIAHVLSNSGNRIDGLLAPGHVSVITGSRLYEPLAERFKVPFVVAGFDDEHLLAAIYALVRMIETGKPKVMNMYPSAVTRGGNPAAREKIERFFETGDAAWRGLGTLPGSGLYLREEFAALDAGSHGLTQDRARNQACRCDDILTGQATPADCPLYGTICTPEDPAGACMVSSEGSCHSAYQNGGGRR